jgi:hypothetical protein
MKHVTRYRRITAFCIAAAACALALAAAAGPASAQPAHSASGATAAAPRVAVSGARAAYQPHQYGSLQLTLQLLGLSVQVSNGYIGASGPAAVVQVACALPLSETDGLGSLCVYSGDNETGEGLIFFPGDNVKAGTCFYVYGDTSNFADNTDQPWDLASVNGNCDNGGVVDALDQSGQDENINPPVDTGQAYFQGSFSPGSSIPAAAQLGAFNLW